MISLLAVPASWGGLVGGSARGGGEGGVWGRGGGERGVTVLGECSGDAEV